MTILSMQEVYDLKRKYVTLRLAPFQLDNQEAEIKRVMANKLLELLGIPARFEDILFFHGDRYGAWEVSARWEPRNLEVETLGGPLDGQQMQVPLDLHHIEQKALGEVDWDAKSPLLDVETFHYDVVGFNTETHRRVFRLVKQPVSNQ